MILSDTTLHQRLHELIGDPDHELVNPASVDIRIGRYVKYEDSMEPWDLLTDGPYILQPKEFVLVDTYETLMVPIDLAVELKLKSSRAREGFNHSLAFWFDPGWCGVGTMEIENICRIKSLTLTHALRFAQIIVHKLDRPAQKPYAGKYQHAIAVEAVKP